MRVRPAAEPSLGLGQRWWDSQKPQDATVLLGPFLPYLAEKALRAGQ